MYDWCFDDGGWQQDFKRNVNYDCIIYNALNRPILAFRQIELHGDRKPITITKRNQKQCDHIKDDTAFIITSNLHPEDLGYDETNCEIKIWKARCLIICIDGFPLFPLIDKLIKQFNVKFKEEDDLPEGCDIFDF